MFLFFIKTFKRIGMKSWQGNFNQFKNNFIFKVFKENIPAKEERDRNYVRSQSHRYS